MSTPMNLTDAAMSKLMGIDLPPPGAEKVRIRIASRTNGQVVHGTLVNFGTSEHDVYDVHVDAFEDLVEDDKLLKLAREQLKRDLPEFQSAKDGKPGAEWRKSYDPSLEAVFRDMFKRDPKPFDSVELVDTTKKKAA